MIDLEATAEQFFLLYFISFLITLCGNSLGLLLGSVISDAKAVAAATSIFLIPFFLFSGQFKNFGSIPAWVGWIQYISPFKYGLAALTINETKYRPSLVDQMNFDIGFWGSVGLLIALAIGYRCLSLFFLWVLRSRIQ